MIPQPSKRLSEKRLSFIGPGTAWQVSVDYLPSDHWIRWRMNTIWKQQLSWQLLHSPPSWLHNEYAENK